MPSQPPPNPATQHQAKPSQDRNATVQPVVLLHEGLGSVSAWRSFPQDLADATGRQVLAIDRPGYGKSGPNPGPWPADFMNAEAVTLGRLLAEEQIVEPILVGHSDGGTIALLYSALGVPAGGPEPAGLVAMAAHCFVEDRCVTRINELRDNRESLVDGLSKHHDRSAEVFDAWTEVWTSDRFRAWQMDEELGTTTCPATIIQGRHDSFSDGGQLERIVENLGGPTSAQFMDCDHWPHRELTDQVLESCRELTTSL